MAIQISAQIAIYILVGFLARKRGSVDEAFCRMLGNFLVNIALPCMIVQALQNGMSDEQLYQCGSALLLALAVLALSALAGQVAYWIMGKSSRGRMFRLGLMISNFTFMGMPAAELLLGETGLFYFSAFTVPIRIFYSSSVEFLLTPPSAQKRNRGGWKRALRSPPIWGVVVGSLLSLTGIQLPEAVDAVVRGLGGTCSPLGMVLCGLSIGGMGIKRLCSLRYLVLPALRLVVMPAIIFAAVYLLPVDQLVKQVAVLYAMLPCAGMLTTYELRYDPEPATVLESSACIFFSSLLSIITLPLWSLALPLL